MKNKILALILALSMLLLNLVACATPSDDQGKDSDGNKVNLEGMLVIDAEYKVVRGDMANNSVIKSALKLTNAIKEKSGVEVTLATDFVKRGDTAPTKEILVGAVERELEFDRTTLEAGEFYIGIEGDRIVIDAADELTLSAFIDQIVDIWLKDGSGIFGEGILAIDNDICTELNAVEFTLPKTISVLSQNVRSADDPNGNSKAERQPRFKQLVAEYDPDLIGTQEVTKDWRTYIQSNFSKDYGIVGCSRSGRNSTGGEFNLILYKLDRFELLDSDTFWLSSTPTTPSKVDGSNFNRICTWVLLKDKLTGEKFVFANTHYDYNGEDNGRIMKEQSGHLLRVLSDKLEQYPAFLTGDFNCQRNSAGYNALTASVFKDAEKNADVNTSIVSGTCSGYGMNPTKTIDFCFYNEKFHPTYFRITENKYGGDVSDHFGIYTEFIFAD